jgi:glycosyltransferase involved in cell wall biosynthesis
LFRHAVANPDKKSVVDSNHLLVSVIIPAFNAQDLIGETLDSVLGQTYKHVEIIVVDDGSTDQTSQVVRSYHPRVLYYYESNSGGCAVPRNTGIEHSSGEFLCFMDADDVMVPDRIARQIDFMGRNPSVGLVFCDYRNFNEQGPYPQSHFQTCPRLWPKLKDQRELILDNACELLARENFGSAGSLFLRKSILRLDSGFEPTLRSCEDLHFYYRLARHSPVGLINEVGMLRRLHSSNMSGNSLTMLSEAIRSRTLLRDTEPDAVNRAYLNRQIADYLGSLARYHADHRQYLKAVVKDWEALSCQFCWPRLRIACRNMARTISIALGLHNLEMKPS